MKNFKKIVLCLIAILLVAAIVVVIVNFTLSKVSKKPNPIVTMEIEGYGTIKIELYPDKAPNTVKNFIKLAQRGYYNGKGFTDVEENLIEGGFNENPVTGEANTDTTNVTPGARLSDIKDNVSDEDNKDYAIEGEFVANGYNDNTLSHERGVISMYRKSYTQYTDEMAMLKQLGYTDYVENIAKEMYDSQSSAFFILTKDITGYDGQYAAFGRVIEGMDIVDAISKLDTQSTTDEEGTVTDTGRPVNVPIIKNVTVETYGVDYGEPKTIDMYDFDTEFNQIMQMFMSSQSSSISY